METPADRHARLAGNFSRIASGVKDWDAPSPVPEWVARDVVEHLTSWSAGFLQAGAGIDLGPFAAQVAHDPQGAWEGHAVAVQKLLETDAPPAFSHPRLGAMPLAEAIDRFYTTDVLMHAWDLAKASGQDVGWDNDEIAELLAGLEPIEEMLRSSGQYGPRVPVPADADAPTRLAGFLGRNPSWTPARAS